MKTLFPTLAVALLVAAVSAHARPGGRFLHAPGLKVLKELNLTPEQEKKIREVHKEKRSKIEGLRARMEQAHAELEAGIKDDNKSDSDLKKLFEKSSDTHAEMQRLHFDSMLAIRNVLTKEQRKEMIALMEKRMQKFRERHQERKDRRGKGKGKGKGKGEDKK